MSSSLSPMIIEASGDDIGSTGGTRCLGQGSVLGDMAGSCGGTTPPWLELLAFWGPVFSKKAVNAPRRERPESDVDDALPTLSVSDCTTD